MRKKQKPSDVIKPDPLASAAGIWWDGAQWMQDDKPYALPDPNKQVLETLKKLDAVKVLWLKQQLIEQQRGVQDAPWHKPDYDPKLRPTKPHFMPLELTQLEKEELIKNLVPKEQQL